MGDNMKEVELQTQNLVVTIKNSNEYNQYHRLLKNIMQDSVLYGRINEFRRRIIELQLGSEGDILTEMNSLYDEFADLLQNQKAEEFLLAEQQYTKLLRSVQNSITEAADIDIEFLEGWYGDKICKD